MIIIIGASASGKTEISKILQKKYNYNKCITTTTRPMRDNERNGVDYHFITKEEFIKKLKDKEFVEHSLYNDNYYGLNKHDVINNGLVIVDPRGANELIKILKKEVFIVFVETSEKIRKSRMENRGDDIDSIKQRLKVDRKVFKKRKLKKVDFVLINEDQSLDELAELVHNKYLKYKEQ